MAPPATAASAAPTSPPKRPRIPVVKLSLFLLVIVLLTPFWIFYGLVGKLLTTSSLTLRRWGIGLLVLLAAALAADLVAIETQHALGASDDTALLIRLAAALTALLLVQWKFHNLVMFVLDGRHESGNAVALFLEVIAPCIGLFALREAVFGLKHWEHTTGLTLYLFGAAYLLTPVVLMLSHAHFWIPARYSELERVEREILTRNVKSEFHMMKVAGLGTVFVPCTQKKNAKPAKTLVLIHGFAAGNALWACNLDALAQHYDVYAVEWVGKGRSDRPEFASYELEDADRIFVDAIENWRKELKLEKFFVAGHSMGAMFASSYAVRYPGHIEHLVLVSPAGVGHPPPPRPIHFGLKVFRYLWSLRLTPMESISLARFMGPFGPAFLRLLAKARVGAMPESSCIRRGDIPVESVALYWYHSWALKASGEVAMHTHLHPGVFAKKPLCVMLTPETIKVPITFMYGGGPDWMESSHGEELAKKFDGHQRVQVFKVPLAGHQVFMDNVDVFNTILLDALAQ
ncbi:hypothetical protein Poli38472_013851 [Pythium oligandrum]|uniref:AB hydrolase-1 domain-containing protein n=1 Tax=Pythium oligandrum TaxID=41045 RepID=A0A8K1C263_PYTOL|nr:hypothetical protein Poli38472_013851 [Pythium oligandrum]|eukprot:TMW55089.1 hypothetical protein Poli38472_013851 [Pythium oligandrum]